MKKNIIIIILLMIIIVLLVKINDNHCYSKYSGKDTTEILQKILSSNYLFENNVLDSTKHIRISKFPYFMNKEYNMEYYRKNISWFYNDNVETTDNMIAFVNFNIKNNRAIVEFNWGENTSRKGLFELEKQNGNWNIKHNNLK